MEEVTLTPAIRLALLPAAGTEQALATVCQEIEQGAAQLWRVPEAPKATYVVTRVETAPQPAELVIVLLAGCCADQVVEWCKEIADFHGWSIRAHLTRADLIERMAGHGFPIAETIVRRPPNGRQQ